MSTLHELERETGSDLASADYWAQARARCLTNWVTAHDPTAALDIGCGSGYITAELADAGIDTTGIDIDPASIAVARSRDTSGRPVEFAVGDARDLQYPANAFEAVVFADVLEHFDDPRPVLEEARRVLTPDGRVFVTVPAYRVLLGPHDEQNDHADRYTSRRLATLADATGFSLERSRHTNLVPLVPYFVTQRLLKRDVPTSARGEHGRLVETLKDGLLAVEERVPWPAGVTLLAELAPQARPSRPAETVLLMNYEYPPRCGGGGVFTRDLRLALDRRGYETRLVTTAANEKAVENGLPDLMKFPFQSLPDLVRELRQQQPDVINAHFALPTALLLPAISKLSGTPYVVNVMGADIYDPTRYHRLRPWMDRINRYGVFRAADRVIAPSTDMRDRLPRDARLKTEVVPYFVDETTYTPPEDPSLTRPVELLTVTRLVPRKNLMTAVETLATLADRGVEASWTVVGTGSQRDPLEAAVREAGLSSRVAFTGYVPDDVLPRVYRDHDVYFMPSAHEGFGIVFLEALASGLPVVASDQGGQTDIVTPDIGAVLPPDDPAGFASAIAEIAREYDAYQTGTRRRVLANYTEDAVLPEYERIYAEVARG